MLSFRPLKTIVRLGADFNTQLGVWQFKSSWEDAIIGGKLTLIGKELQLTKSWQLSVGKEHTFDVDQSDSEIVLVRLNQLVTTVLERAQEMGVSGRLAEVKIRYTGFETHTHGRSIPVAMDDAEVFSRLAQQLFANNLQHKEKVRLIGFRLGNLEMPISRQITLQL